MSNLPFLSFGLGVRISLNYPLPLVLLVEYEKGESFLSFSSFEAASFVCMSYLPFSGDLLLALLVGCEENESFLFLSPFEATSYVFCVKLTLSEELLFVLLIGFEGESYPFQSWVFIGRA